MASVCNKMLTALSNNTSLLITPCIVILITESTDHSMYRHIDYWVYWSLHVSSYWLLSLLITPCIVILITESTDHSMYSHIDYWVYWSLHVWSYNKVIIEYLPRSNMLITEYLPRSNMLITEYLPRSNMLITEYLPRSRWRHCQISEVCGWC